MFAHVCFSDVFVVYWSCTTSTPSLMLPHHWTCLESWLVRVADITVADRVLGSSGCIAANTAPAALLEKLFKIFKFCPSTTTAWIKRACLGILGCGRAGYVCYPASRRKALSWLLVMPNRSQYCTHHQGRPTVSWVVWAETQPNHQGIIPLLFSTP